MDCYQTKGNNVWNHLNNMEFGLPANVRISIKQKDREGAKETEAERKGENTANVL